MDDNMKNNEPQQTNAEAEDTTVEKKAVTAPEKKDKVSFTKKRSFKFGTMATAFTAIFIAIIVLLNVLLTVFAQKYPLSIDLTKNKDYGITQQSIDYVKKVKNPIKITFFATKAKYEASTESLQVNKIIEMFPKYSDKISIEYIDFDKNPTAVAQYADENISEGDLVVSSEVNGKKRYKHITYGDLMVTQTDQTYGTTTAVGNKAEQEIDNAIDYVSVEKTPTIAFTQGHDEVASTDLQSLYKSGNYNVSTINLSSTDIAEGTDAIAVVAPNADFSDAEIAKIDTFLKNGGKYGKNVFIFLDPRLKETPKLEAYLEEWGVKAESGVIYDNTNNFNNSVWNVMAQSVSTDVAGKNISSGIKTDVTAARPLTLTFDTKNGKTTSKVIETGDTARVLKDLSGKTSDNDAKGPFTTMTLTKMGSTSAYSNMIVSGSYEMTLSAQTSASNKNNSKVLIGIANTLMQKESGITITNKYNDTSTLSLTTGQRTAIAVIFAVIIPLALLVIGLVTWLRRRHL